MAVGLAHRLTENQHLEQRISIWSVFILTFAILELASLIYDYLKKKQKTA